MNANLKTLAVAALLAVCFGAQEGHAGPVGPLTTFTPGATVKSSEMNGNFSVVRTAVDDNANRIMTLESVNAATRLTTLEGVNAASRLATLETTVTPAGSVVPTGNILLPSSTATAGNVLKGGAPFIHNFGSQNTFIGVNAGNFTMGGGGNTASGVGALLNNTTGGNNTASGQGALLNNTTGGSNTASGDSALGNNTAGFQNTASGASALQSNTIGTQNTASGVAALQANTTGSQNTASGVAALQSNTTGANNVALGFNAGGNLTTGSFNIAIGSLGVAGEAATIRIGSTSQTRAFISGIRGVTTATVAIPVVVGTDGQLGTISSSRRVKDDIADMGEASGTLMKLRPVTFHYKSDKNPKGRTLQYGLVAEEVAKIAPGLVAHSADGKVETVYYQFLAPMLLNEYQRQQRTIQAQAAQLEKQTAKLEKQAMEIAELRQQAARIAELENQAARMTAVLGRLERAGMVASVGR